MCDSKEPYRKATIVTENGKKEEVILCDTIESMDRAHGLQIQGKLDCELPCIYFGTTS